MKTLTCLIVGLLVSLTAWTEESNADKINAEEIKELKFEKVFVCSQPNEKGMLKLIREVCIQENLIESSFSLPLLKFF